MYSEAAAKKYEEFAYVLDFIPNGKSVIIQEREGPLAQAIGEERLTLLEILATEDATFQAGEKIPIGKDNRSKVVSVLGKLNYDELTNDARNESSWCLGKDDSREREEICGLLQRTPADNTEAARTRTDTRNRKDLHAPHTE